jgi:hypothetical protein
VADLAAFARRMQFLFPHSTGTTPERLCTTLGTAREQRLLLERRGRHEPAR